MPSEGPDPFPLAVAMANVRVALPMVDNLGRTGDARDLHQLVDTLAAGARAAFPESLCKAGCSDCCYYPTSLFNVKRTEWDAIVRYIEANWSVERRQAFVERFWHEHGPYVWRLRILGYLVGIPLPVFPEPQSVPAACPFLEADRCSIYPARPTQCRAFGHFSVQYWWRRQPLLYGCLEQVKRLRTALQEPGRAQLPSLNPLEWKLWGLAFGPKRLLALWVAKTWPRRTIFEALNARLVSMKARQVLPK
ncbi:MAG: YkgJ family cysteine cluster protein [Cyanobacteria bacterium REEB65]|nr:YkgJ family cysteine cluster protein [Cyanobacteria bacterium REEB65]